MPLLAMNSSISTPLSGNCARMYCLRYARIPVGQAAEPVPASPPTTTNPSTVIDSVKRTGRLIVADYDWLHCGFGAEVAVRVYEACGADLRCPVRRLAFADAHVPCTRPLENAFYPNAVDIIRTAEAMLERPPADLDGEEFFSYEKKFKGPF